MEVTMPYMKRHLVQVYIPSRFRKKIRTKNRGVVHYFTLGITRRTWEKRKIHPITQVVPLRKEVRHR